MLKLFPDMSISSETTSLSERPIFIFDIDYTIIGDVVSLSDGDNLEANIEWQGWPENKPRGIPISVLEEAMTEGILRPGFKEIVAAIKKVNGIIVFYTNSEDVWGKKICEAVENVTDFKTDYLFCRSDCKDSQYFLHGSQKCLIHILNKMGLPPSSIQQIIMFEDTFSLCSSHEERIIMTPKYRFNKHYMWNKNIDDEFLLAQPLPLKNKVVCAIRDWGIVHPTWCPGEDEDCFSARMWNKAEVLKRTHEEAVNRTCHLDKTFETMADAIREWDGKTSVNDLLSTMKLTSTPKALLLTISAIREFNDRPCS